MGLGCILCRRPLFNYVTPRRINWAKANGVSSKTPSFHDHYQHKNHQVMASTCGHLFHRQCLKSFFTVNAKKHSTNAHKLCPYCNSSFQLEKCFPIYMKPENDETGQEMKRLIHENNKLQQNMIVLKKLVKKREAELQSILSDIEQMESLAREHNIDIDAVVGEQARTVRDARENDQQQDQEQQDRVLETDEEEMLRNVSTYSNLNQRLMSMIQETLKVQTSIWNPAPDASSVGAYNYSPLYNRPGTARFQSGQFFNAAPLRTQYASYNSINMMDENTMVEPEAPYQTCNTVTTGIGVSGPFPNPNLELNYFHQLETLTGTGGYNIGPNSQHRTTHFEPTHVQPPIFSNTSSSNRMFEAPRNSYPCLVTRQGHDTFKPQVTVNQNQLQGRFYNVSPYECSINTQIQPPLPPNRTQVHRDPQRPAFLKEMPSVSNYNNCSGP